MMREECDSSGNWLLFGIKLKSEVKSKDKILNWKETEEEKKVQGKETREKGE